MAGSITIIGEPELRRKFREMPLRLQRKGLRRGVTKAARVTRKAAKDEAPKETGLLGQSLGYRVFTFRDKSGVGAVVGVRKGFRKAVVKRDRGKRRGSFRKARKSEESSTYRNPAKYLHLVLLGTEHSEPNNFLLRAAQKTHGESIRIISGDVRQQLLSEAVTR